MEIRITPREDNFYVYKPWAAVAWSLPWERRGCGRFQEPDDQFSTFVGKWHSTTRKVSLKNTSSTLLSLGAGWGLRWGGRWRRKRRRRRRWKIPQPGRFSWVLELYWAEWKCQERRKWKNQEKELNWIDGDDTKQTWINVNWNGEIMYTPHSCTGGVLINLQWLKHHKHHKLDLQVAQTRQTGPAVAHFAEAARALQ